jgi:phosphatidylglycerophosphate synthase
MRTTRLANWITLSRLPLLLINLLILYLGSSRLRLAGAGLLLAGFLLDTVDGIVARSRGEASLAGSVLDIAVDRIYELVLWVAFADLGLVPVSIPLVVIARTALTDALRSLGVARGTAPLDQARTPLARFLVCSPWMRIGYSVAKVTALCGLAAAHAIGASAAAARPWLLSIAWLAVAICLLRGLPVLLGAASSTPERAAG